MSDNNILRIKNFNSNILTENFKLQSIPAKKKSNIIILDNFKQYKESMVVNNAC